MKSRKKNFAENCLILGLLTLGIGLISYAALNLVWSAQADESAIAEAYDLKQEVVNKGFEGLLEVIQLTENKVPGLRRVYLEIVLSEHDIDKQIVNYLVAVRAPINPAFYGPALMHVRESHAQYRKQSQRLKSRIISYQVRLDRNFTGQMLKTFGYPKISFADFQKTNKQDIGISFGAQRSNPLNPAYDTRSK